MRIALCQIVSTPDPSANLELVADGVRRAAQAGARVAIFPEATMACFGTKLAPLAEPLDGPWATRVRQLAHAAGMTVVAGMFTPETTSRAATSPNTAGPETAGRVTNTLLVTGPEVETSYDKIHLYDAFGFAESRTVAAGDSPVTVPLGALTLGLSTCYDVRFPGLFTRLADAGASVIVTAASWGAGVGKRGQWDLLVRARALDSTSWVLGCGQADPRSIGREPATHAPTGIGHSLVATPFGQVHACLAEGPDQLIVDVDEEQVRQARASVPVLANRKF